MRKLRIAFLVNSFPSVSETFIVNQITYFLDQGHDVEIFSFHRGNMNIVHEDILKYKLLEKTSYFKDVHKNRWKRIIEIIRYYPLVKKNKGKRDYLRALNPFLFGRSAINLTLVNEIIWFRRRRPFHIIHCHFGPNGVFIAKLKKAGFLKEVSFLNTFHGYDFRPELLLQWQTQYKNLFEQAALLTYNTPYSRDILFKITSLQHKLVELPMGLDTNDFVRQPNIAERNNNVFNILFCGRLVDVKAPYMAVLIVKHIVEVMGIRNIELKIIGDGYLAKSTKELIAELKLRDFITIKGELNQTQIRREMSQSDVFLLPGIVDDKGRAETQGLVIQEAQAMGLPVVVSDAGGMKYGLLNGVTGFVVPQKDVGAFAETLVKLMKQPDLRKKLGEAGRRFVVENYDKRVLGKKLENLYFRILDKAFQNS